jgi:hypothetical protein
MVEPTDRLALASRNGGIKRVGVGVSGYIFNGSILDASSIFMSSFASPLFKLLSKFESEIHAHPDHAHDVPD